MSNIVVPQLGESVVEARVARWLKKEGDRVEIGEPARRARDREDRSRGQRRSRRRDHQHQAAGGRGRQDRRAARDGRRKRGRRCATAPAGGTVRRRSSPMPRPHRPRRARRRRRPRQRLRPRRSPGAGGDADGPRATPTARSMAKAHDVNLGAVQGSGSAGRVMKQDVQNALGGQAAPSAAPGREARAAPAAKPAAPTAKPPARSSGGRTSSERERMSKRRATIARRLVEAQRTAAMLTTFNEIDMTALMALRERRKEAFKKRVRRRASASLRSSSRRASPRCTQFPQLNAEIQGDEIVHKHYYDIGMAVGAEGGLVVPVLRDADRMSFAAARAGHPRLRHARRRRHADARGSDGRHVHDHQRRRLRLAAEHADPESAAGRHPRPPQDPGPAVADERAGRRSGR